MSGPEPFFALFPLLIPAILFLAALYVVFSLMHGRSVRSGHTEYPDLPSSVLKIVYTLALAGLIAAFVGFGIQAVYPSPQYPDEEPFYSEAYGEGMAMQGGATVGAPDEAMAQEVPSEEFEEPGIPPEVLESERVYMQQMRSYEEQLSEHHQVASLMAIGPAALLLVVG